jgi:hypothetical protein
MITFKLYKDNVHLWSAATPCQSDKIEAVDESGSCVAVVSRDSAGEWTEALPVFLDRVRSLV